MNIDTEKTQKPKLVARQINSEFGLSVAPLKHGRWWTTFCLFVILFICWPKYLSIDVGFARISPTNILSLFFILSLGPMWALWNAQGQRISIGGYWILAFYSATWISRVYSDFETINYMHSIFLTLRDFTWTAFCFVFAFRLAGGREGIPGITKVLIFSALIIATIGILERMTGVSTASWIFAHIPIRVSDDYATTLLQDKTRDGGFRVQSVMGHPLIAGEAFSALLPVCLAGTIYFQGSWRAISGVTLLFVSAALIFTGSRSALVAVGAGTIAYTLVNVLRSINIWTRVFGTGAVVAALLVGTPLALSVVAELRAGQTAAEIGSSGWRDQMWRVGAPAIVERPYFGHGDGQSLEIAGVRVGSGLTVDDYYLTQLLDFGYVNIAVFVTFVAMSIWAGAFSGPRDLTAPLYAALVGGVIAILSAQKATSIFEGMGILYLYCGILASVTIMPAARFRRLPQTT